jgi:UDP-N-acetylglucosamine:LPS N-acetylglucosamine transferase
VSKLSDSTQRTILFLIADTGAGHRSAANAITNAIRIISQREQEEWHTHHQQPTAEKTSAADATQSSNPSQTVDSDVVQTADVAAPDQPPPTYRIEIVDVFENYSRFPLREAMNLYGPTVRFNSKLFGEIFNYSNHEETVKAYNTFTTPLIFNGMLRLITTLKPDVVVSVHPLLNFITISVLQELDLKIPFITVVTDMVSVHYTWFAPGADAYIVATEQARKLYLKRGLDPERISVLGMPIDPKYTREVESKEELRRNFNLVPNLPVVLLVGGGDGTGGLQPAVRAISQARLPVQLMIVTGRNKKLYAQLQRMRQRLYVPAKIFGFVNNMPELMHAADVLVTKAGPGTICEALSCNLPIILSGYISGQEEGNVDYVVENDVGALALDGRTLVDELRRLLRPGSQELRRRLSNAARISRPAASFAIGEKILSFLPPPGEPGVWQSQRSTIVKHRMSGRLQSAIRIRRLARGRNGRNGKKVTRPTLGNRRFSFLKTLEQEPTKVITRLLNNRNDL